MEEVRQLVQEEGREARNLVAFHVAVDSPARVARKPPRTSAPPRRVTPRSAARLRSASAGRDKRSELRARYWALLFGDLQRAVGEIYNTVEAHENLNECQEVILVLENYTRDFKALGEWFRLKWEYDNTPPPQRPQSLAWEIRKTDFVRPESRRTHSVKSSPSVSGKNSPCLSGHNTPSGKNSPNLTGKASPGSGKISPRILGHSSTSPKGSVEFFSNKITSKIATKPEPKSAKETRLSDIKEKDTVAIEDDKKIEDSLKDKDTPKPIVEIGRAKGSPNVIPKAVVIKTPKRTKPATEDKKTTSDSELCSQAKATVTKLDAMENEFLANQLFENAAKNENVLNEDLKKDRTTRAPETKNDSATVVESTDRDCSSTIPPGKFEDSCADIFNESTKSEEIPREIIYNEEIRPPHEDIPAVTKAKNTQAKKKVNKKEQASKIGNDFPSKEVKVTDSKRDREKEPNTKSSNPNRDPKTKFMEKHDTHVDLNNDQNIDWAELCQTEINERKDIEKPRSPIKADAKTATKDVKTDTKDDKKEDFKASPKIERKKSQSKSPESNNLDAAGNKIDATDAEKLNPTDSKTPKIQELVSKSPDPCKVHDKDLKKDANNGNNGISKDLEESKIMKPESTPEPSNYDAKEDKSDTNDCIKEDLIDDKKTESTKVASTSLESGKVYGKGGKIDGENRDKAECRDPCKTETKKPGSTSPEPSNVNDIKIDAKDGKKEESNEHKKTEGKKPESKSREPINADTKEHKTDLKDGRKDDSKESKKTETKLGETKPPARPAYSQAAAKPKLVTAKTEIKTPTKTALYRSKTVVEIRPNSAPNRQLRSFPNRNQKSKCSYPFNLTTGRTSLFDTPGAPKVIAIKRPISRPQLAAGDISNQIKPDLKTRPPRPDSLKINEQGDKQEKNNPAFEKIKDCDEYSSSDTLVTHIDMSRIESSESLKTLVPDGYDVANSIEVLNVDGDKTDNDGWLTVKSRRLSRESKKSKNHWSNRFHQPSATTSLPTLNMIESPKSETNPIIDAKLDRAKSEQPQNKPEKVVRVTAKKESKAKGTAMIRQKSDVTGLKTRSSRNKALKKDKNRDKKGPELTKNRLHSSLESLTTGLARSQESTEDDAFDFDKWKAEFMTTFKYLEEDDQMTDHNEILKSADPSEMSEIAEMTSQIEENERKISLALDFQSEADQRKLCQEEDLLNRQIMELQQVSDIDIDTETDDTETDAEILCEDTAIVPCKAADSRICRDLASCLEHHYESALEGMSWSERIDMLGALEELVARDPGRAQQLHAKLSQGIKRRGSLQDVLRRLQAKQARAEKQRKQLHTERAKKIHQLLARVEEVKMAKNQLIDEKRNRMERRLQKAAENRDQHLKDIVRKAHDEEEKLREIAFIKQLEAENRRHEFLDHTRSLTTRLREMRKDRLDKLEQKAAREAAVGARRQALEAARKQHVESLLEKRKERDQRREELKELKKQERDDAAREKAEGVKFRLSALAAAAELEALALKSRIRDKQDASQQRWESHLQAIREKATGPRQLTTSESQDQSSQTIKEQDEEVARLEQERREREKQKAMRKKARKLKQKLLASSKADAINIKSFYPAVTKMHRTVTQLYNVIAPLTNPDLKQNSDVDGPRKNKMNDSNDNNNTNQEDFKYDIEDKLGKKKKKKKQEKVDSQQNNQKSSDDTQHNKVNDGNKCQVNIQKPEKKKNNQQKSNGATNNIEIDATKNSLKPNGKQKNKDLQSNYLHNNKNVQINDIQKNKNDTLVNKNDAQNDKNDAQIDINDTQKNKNNTQNTQKKNQVNETQRLSKSNSICSSMSDMSKASTKCERPVLLLDIALLEKLVGELYRMTTSKDCNDNIPKSKSKSPDVTVLTKVYAVNTLGILFSILAEREDLLSQVTLKCIAMSVVTTTRMMTSCKSTALYFFTTHAVVHTISLLNYQLNKDLSDPKEVELAKQLSDLVSVSLDAALCESRQRDCEGEEQAMGAIRARAHNLISYLCLSGCIGRAEHAGEARERVQTLVTLCADLCQEHKTDCGPERASAVQALRCALGTGLMGSRAEFCMLFAEGAELSRSQNFVRAARTAHLLRQLAELDHQIVQDAFGEGGWPLEFRAAVARLLSQHAPNDKEAPSSDILHLSNQRLHLNLSEQMVLDLIVLLGFVVVNNPMLHDTICENWSVIKTLTTLPANWLVSIDHCHALLPTLVVLASRSATAEVIFSELSMKMLDNYMLGAEGKRVKLIHILKGGKDKAAKKEKQKKDKQQRVVENVNSSRQNIPNGDIKGNLVIPNNMSNSENANNDNSRDVKTNGDVKLAEDRSGDASDMENVDYEV